jgi:hypothetical protein
MARWRLNRELALDRLKQIDPGENPLVADEEYLRRMDLATNLTRLAGIDHWQEYGLCQEVADHLLGDRGGDGGRP